MNNDENTNKTTWIKKKKNVFSDSSNNIDENFQIMNMKQRVMNAFKKKKARALHQENYKNIELLQNIYDISGNEPSTMNDNSSNDLSNASVSKEPSVIENFKDSDHDGIDKPDPKRKKGKLGNPLLNFFDDIYKRIDRFNYNKAKFIAKVLSNKTNTEKDILLIKYYIALFETIGVSYFSAYNWFYFMFYSEDNKDSVEKQTGGGFPSLGSMGKSGGLDMTKLGSMGDLKGAMGKSGGLDMTKLGSIGDLKGAMGKSGGLDMTKLGSMGDLKDAQGLASSIGSMGDENGETDNSNEPKKDGITNYFTNMFKSISSKIKSGRPEQTRYSEGRLVELSITYVILDLFLFVGQYFIKYTEFFQYFMISILPGLWSMFNRKTTFILLFLCFIYLIFIYSRTLHKAVIDACNMNFKNENVIILFLILVLCYMPSYWFPSKDNSPAELEKASQTMNLVMQSLYIMVPFLIFRCFRAFFILYLTIPFGVSILLLYFVYYSIFGIFGHKWFNPFKTYEAFKEIYIFIKKGETHPETKPGANLSFMQKFMVVFNNFCESLHRYILYIAYIIMLLVAMVDYYNKIDSVKLKTNMLIVSFTLILSFASLCVAGFMSHGLSEADDISGTVNEEVKNVIDPTVENKGMFSNVTSKLTSMFSGFTNKNNTTDTNTSPPS